MVCGQDEKKAGQRILVLCPAHDEPVLLSFLVEIPPQASIGCGPGSRTCRRAPAALSRIKMIRPAATDQ